MSEGGDGRSGGEAVSPIAEPTESFPDGAPLAGAPDDASWIGARVGKYEVRRVIGSGGAGVVVAGRDVELGRDVAIKFLMRDTDEARARLMREAQAMAQLSHPNVVTVYEVLRLSEQTGIVMELVDGRDLAGWCSSPRTWREVIEAYVQAGRGLAAAHRAGLVHRDFKPANVLIDAVGVVRVTDFGLVRTADDPARWGSASDELVGDRDLTRTGAIVGTPAYMAPEQHAGGDVDARTDQWALACSLYGALYDQRPFAGDTHAELRASVLAGALRGEPPRTPVPERLRAAIRRGLARDPADRFATMDDLVAALTRRGSRWLAVAVVAVAAAIAIVAAVAVLRSPPPASPHRVVAVLGFKNATGRADVAWLSTGFSEMLASELGSEAIRVVPTESVARATLELGLAPGTMSTATLARVRADLGAELVVVGSYVVDDAGQVRVDVALQDTATGDTTVIPAIGTTRELFALVTDAGGRLRRALGVASPAATTPGSGLPLDAAAARLYLEGVALMRRFDPLAARSKLEAAVARGPESPLAHGALARVLGELGDNAAARTQARAALDHADRLPKREAHLVKASYFETTRDWTKAADEYRALIREIPGDVDFGLGLASALVHAGDVEAAFAILDRLRTLPPPDGTDPRIDLAAARAADQASDFHREQAAAADAVRRGRTTGALLLVAEARTDEAWASRRLGDHARADAALAEARATFESLGYRRGVAKTRNQLATVMLDHGDLAGARREAEAAIALSASVGDGDGEAEVWSNLAEILQGLGDLAGASDAYTKVLVHARASNNPTNQAAALLNLGLVALHQGNPAAGRTRIEEALPGLRAAGNRYGEAIAVGSLGGAARMEGDLAAARSQLADAFAILRTIGDRQDAASVQLEAAAIARITGDRAGARKLLEELHRESEELQLDTLLAGGDLELARIAADEGNLGEAVRAARAAAERYRRAASPDLEARARAFLAVVLASSGHLPEATPELERASALSKASQDRLLHIDVAVANARVDGARGHVARAVEALRAIAGATDTPIEQRLDARLAEARLTGALGALAKVEREATKEGFAAIADVARRRD